MEAGIGLFPCLRHAQSLILFVDVELNKIIQFQHFQLWELRWVISNMSKLGSVNNNLWLIKHYHVLIFSTVNCWIIGKTTTEKN